MTNLNWRMTSRHSILTFVIRISSFVIPSFIARLFDRANFVAQAGGLFVFFGGDGFLHFAAQADQLRLLFGAAGAELGHFADVARFAVDVERAAARARWRSRCSRAGSRDGLACGIRGT